MACYRFVPMGLLKLRNSGLGWVLLGSIALGGCVAVFQQLTIAGLTLLIQHAIHVLLIVSGVVWLTAE